MATITGKTGYVKFGTDTSESELTEASEWSIDYSIESIETTEFSSSGVTAKSYIMGLADWTATVTSDFDDAATPTAPSTTAASLLLYYDDTHFFDSAGTGAYLTGLSITTPVAGKIAITYSFQGNGAIASLWA